MSSELVEKYLRQARDGAAHRNHRKSLHYYVKALTILPDQPLIWQEIFQANRWRISAKLLDPLERAIALRHEHLPYRLTKARILENISLTQALETLDHALTIAPDDASTLLAKAILLTNHYFDEPAKARVLCEQVLRSLPDDPMRLLDIHLQLKQAEQDDLAIQCYEHAVQLGSDGPDFWEKAARCISDRERRLNYMQRAATLAPDDTKIWTDLHNLLKEAGRFADAAAISPERLSFRFEASLREFFHTGELGPLKLGMRREEVRELLGEAEGWQGEEWGLPDDFWVPLGKDGNAIWYYSGFELYFGFESNRLHMIFNDHTPFLGTDGYALKLDGWIFAQLPPSREQFIDALKAEGIAFEEKLQAYYGEFHLESGVQANYGFEKNDMGLIASSDDAYSD